MRLYVVGTDTGIGKTRATAALAFAHARASARAHAYARERTPHPAYSSETAPQIRRATIVKLVQTGLEAGEAGDASDAASLVDAALRAAAPAIEMPSPTPWRELARFREPADPWNAALAEGAEPLAVEPLVRALEAISGDLIVEGSGGAAVPLDAHRSISEIARAASCEAIIVVGLRLGCISHALLTLAYLEALGLRVRGAITTEPFGPVTDAYHHQVERALVAKGLRTRHIGWDPDPTRSLANSAAQLTPFLENR